MLRFHVLQGKDPTAYDLYTGTISKEITQYLTFSVCTTYQWNTPQLHIRIFFSETNSCKKVWTMLCTYQEHCTTIQKQIYFKQIYLQISYTPFVKNLTSLQIPNWSEVPASDYFFLKGQMHHHNDLGSKCAYTCHLSNKTTRKSVLLSTPQIWLMKVCKTLAIAGQLSTISGMK